MVAHKLNVYVAINRTMKMCFSAQNVIINGIINALKIKNNNIAKI